MNPTTLAAAVRRFPLLGRPRPACPSLPERAQEIADIARAATADGADRLNKAAHALNKAALIASDCGLTDLARDLCWRHIDIYRAAERPLAMLHARYMLEPVLNLARLQLRASDGDQALRLLTAMFQAIKSNTDLVVDGRTLPLTDLVGSRAEHHKLREWVWLHLLGDGIRALALAGRWDDAVAHAHTHRGIGLHLMEGRQATIIAHCVNSQFEAARAALAQSTPEQPWELQVAACLATMSTDTDSGSTHREITALVERFAEHQPAAGYAFFHTQLGLTVTTLASAIDAEAAARVLTHVTDEAITSGDGYAAREVLRYRDTPLTTTSRQHTALADLLDASGLGSRQLPEPLLQGLLDSTQAAAEALDTALQQPQRPAMHA